MDPTSAYRPTPIHRPMAGMKPCTSCQTPTLGAWDDFSPTKRLSVCCACQERAFPAEALGRYLAARGGYPLAS